MYKFIGETLAPSLAVALFAFGFTYAFLSAIDMPDVWFSYSTGECVKVLNYTAEDQYSCENLPRKFNHVWVE